MGDEKGGTLADTSSLFRKCCFLQKASLCKWLSPCSLFMLPDWDPRGSTQIVPTWWDSASAPLPVCQASGLSGRLFEKGKTCQHLYTQGLLLLCLHEPESQSHKTLKHMEEEPTQITPNPTDWIKSISKFLLSIEFLEKKIWTKNYVLVCCSHLVEFK